MSGDGMELPLRGNMEPSIPPSSFVQAPSQRRATLADLSKEFQKGHVKVKPRYDLLAILIIYTLARIVANLFVTDFVNAVLRPVITGLGISVFISPWSQYSEKLRLHVLSWRAILCLAVFLFDESISVWCWRQLILLMAGPGWDIYVLSLLFWEISCNVLQVCMTTLKIRALGWHRAARCCDGLVMLGCGFATLSAICLILDVLHVFLLAAGFVAFGCNCTTIFLQSVSLLTASCKATAQAYRRSDAAMVWTAVCLVVNTILVVAGPALSWQVLFTIESTYDPRFDYGVSWVTIDICFQVLNALLLSGMIGGQRFDLKEFRRLAEVSGFGLASKRIAFPGKINPDAKDCIVSFPGKYSAEWDEAVKAVREETSTCSLACVFLTDTASGLGQHAKLPEKPEECWCHVIYGYHPSSAYLSVVDVKDLELKQDETEATVLAFKEKDAKAMGQCLLIKRYQTELEWQIELAEALVYAEQLCYKNKGRAPWGCMWFEAWRKKVEEAHRLNQRLHVFYFKDQCGKGKLAWNQLCDTGAKEIARKDTGLGASQTAEVAYLEKEGIPFEEHDINAFTELIAPNSSAIGCDREERGEKIRPYDIIPWNHILGFRDCILSRPAWVAKLGISTWKSMEGFFCWSRVVSSRWVLKSRTQNVKTLYMILHRAKRMFLLL